MCIRDSYNRPNVLSSSHISLDDTQYHEPRYETGEQAITSGVGEDGVTSEPQEVVFEQVGDMIADLIKPESEGGAGATVELDTDHVYDGWEAEFVKPNEGDYDVRVTAPAGATPGTFAQPRVVVTYTNGTKDVLPLLTVFNPNDTQTTDVEYSVQVGVQGKKLEARPTLRRILGKKAPKVPKSYAVDATSIPEGWQITVADDGTVTAVSPADAPNHSVAKPVITATYPDGTTDEVSVIFQVVTSVKVPTYEGVNSKPGAEVTLSPAMPTNGIDGNPQAEEPSSYSFPDGTHEYRPASNSNWVFTIDEHTGEILSLIHI